MPLYQVKAHNVGEFVKAFLSGVDGQRIGLLKKDEPLVFDYLYKQKSNPEIRCLIAVCYLRGLGVPRDYDEAVSNLKVAQALGCLNANYYLGLCRNLGRGLLRSNVEGYKLFLEGAEKGNALCLKEAGLGLLAGVGVTADNVKGIAMLKKAASLEDPDALYELGNIYLEGVSANKDLKKAIDLLLKAAKLGHPKALYRLSHCYFEGLGVTKDQYVGLSYLRKAAHVKHPLAVYELGLYHERLRHYEEAFRLYEAASSLGVRKASYKLGTFYLYGKYVEKDEKKATWYFFLFYRQQEGVNPGHHDVPPCFDLDYPDDIKKATENYGAASRLGKGQAWVYLGCYLLSQSDSPTDDKRAVSFLRRSISYDLPETPFFQGYCYEFGRGIKQNPILAKMSYQKAWKLGYTPAKEAYKRCPK